jgi:hypothetical protein
MFHFTVPLSVSRTYSCVFMCIHARFLHNSWVNCEERRVQGYSENPGGLGLMYYSSVSRMTSSGSSSSQVSTELAGIESGAKECAMF